MAITLYRSCDGDTRETCERVEALGHLTEKTGDTLNISDGTKEMLVSALGKGELDIFRSALVMATLIERFHMTQAELAADLGVSQSSIANRLRLLRYEEDERESILAAGLGERHARALLRLPSVEERRRCLERVIRERLSVQETERLVSSLSPEPPSRVRRGKGMIRDLRFFCNSIDRAVDLARRAGVEVELERREAEGVTEMRIRVCLPQKEGATS